MKCTSKPIETLILESNLNGEIAKFLQPNEICRLIILNKSIHSTLTIFLNSKIGKLLKNKIESWQIQTEINFIETAGAPIILGDDVSYENFTEQKFPLTCCTRMKFFKEGICLSLAPLTLTGLGITLLVMVGKSEYLMDKVFFYTLGGLGLGIGSAGICYILNAAHKSWRACTRVSELLSRQSIYANEHKHDFTSPLLQDNSASEIYLNL